MINELGFTKHESKITFVLVLTFSVRLMALFMLLPIFSVRAQEYLGANAQLTGIAAGIYGFPQALLQIPFGYLSDRWGRKPLLLCGFLLLAIGSVVCALAQDIYVLIIGRALQGAGAVGSVVTAAIADNTRPIVRTRAMAFLGMAIGASFLIAIALGPSFDMWFGISGIFWFTCAAALICMLLCVVFLPAQIKVVRQQQSWREVRDVIFERQLVFFSMGIMFLHAILSAFFLVLPVFMRNIDLSGARQSYLYLGILTLAMLLSYRAIYAADKRQNILKLDKLSILYLTISILLTYLVRENLILLSLFLLIFFVAFCVLEASMPALVSKCAPAAHRGLALGFFSSAQFFGIFIGSLLGGLINQHFGLVGVIYFASSLAFVWLIMAGCFREKLVK